MDKSAKEEAITQIEDRLSRCTIAIVTDYRGLSVADMRELRGKLKESSTEYRVIKNTMARFAAEKAGKEELKEFLMGPTAIAIGYGDVTESAKALANHVQASKLPLTVRGGIMGNRLLNPADITFLATIPPKDVLVSQLLGMMQNPITSLMFVLNANLRSLAQVLEARRRQLEAA